MKKRLTLFIIVIILIMSTSGCKKEYDFRETNWGMSKEKVIASESSKVSYEDMSTVVYKVEYLGIDFDLMYEFEAKKLYKATYVLSRDARPDQWIRDYNYMKEMFVEEYGSPAMEILTLNGVVTTHVEDLQLSDLIMGKVCLFSTWAVEDKFLAVELMAADGKIILTEQHYKLPK